MNRKLSYRNVKRQIGNYMIYFFSVSLMLALLFAMNNLTYSDSMRVYSEDGSDFFVILRGITIFVCVTTALFMGYATSFMVKLRKKEFGMYLTMGMGRGDIQRVFLGEILIMNVLSLAVGCLLGIFFSQLLSILFSVLLDYEIKMMAISMEGFGLTFLMSIAMFSISSVSSVLYLRKVNVIDLLHAEKKEKGGKWLPFHIVCTILFLAFLVLASVKEYKGLMNSFNGSDGPADVMLWLLGIIMGVFFFSLSFARSLTGILLLNKKRISKGTNVFVLRNISGVISVNSLMIAVLSTILTLSLGIACVAFVEKQLTVEYLEKETPFSLNGELNDYSLITADKAEEIVSHYATVKEKLVVPVYRYENECKQDTCIYYDAQFDEEENDEADEVVADETEKEFDDQILNIADSYLRLSDYNRILAMKGKKPVELKEDEFMLAISSAVYDRQNLLKDKQTVNGHEMKLVEIMNNHPDYLQETAFYIVPDHVVEGMGLYAYDYIYNFENDRIDAYGLYNALQVTSADGSTEGNYFTCRAVIKQYYAEEAGNLIIGLGYISLVFLLMSMAVLALKILAGLSEDKIRYDILDRLGVDKRGREKALLKQTSIYFLLPAVCPVCLTPALAYAFGDVAGHWGVPKALGAGVTCTVAVALLLIYAMYLIITYEVSKKSVIG